MKIYLLLFLVRKEIYMLKNTPNHTKTYKFKSVTNYFSTQDDNYYSVFNKYPWSTDYRSGSGSKLWG